MATVEMNVTGMSCSGCSGTVHDVLVALGGVSSATVDHASGATTVEHDGSVDSEAIASAVRDAGFGVATCLCTNCNCDPCGCTGGSSAANAKCKCTSCQCDPCVCN